MAGVSRQQYTPDIKIIRVMCTGRVDLSFIFRAFLNGKDGVFIGGCWPGECHYITEGNYLALSTMHIGRKLLEMIGVSPDRLRLEWISSSEGNRYAEVMNDFSRQMTGSGPLGRGEGIDQNTLKRKLEVVQNLIPYIKLVERERFRVPLKSIEDYNQFFTSDEFDRLFKELIADQYEISRIMALLREKPCSTGEISEILGIEPAQASIQITRSARQGFVEFDESQKRFVPVQVESA